MRDDLYITIVVKFSCTRGSKSWVNMRSLLKVYIPVPVFQSAEVACLIVQHTRQCIYTHFIALVIC